MGEKLTDEAEVLFRQIHPDLMQDGEPASSSFRPKEADNDKLSVDRGALTTASDAHALYTSNGHRSAAVYGITVSEFAGCGIPCEDDPLEETEEAARNPAHALASFAGYGTSKQKTLGKRLKKFAVARGCLHSHAEGDDAEAEDG
jgi:hypothetical protein